MEANKNKDIGTTEQDSDMEGKYLTFFVEKQLMAIPICDVVQIVGMQAITEIPDSVPYLKGVTNLRGTIIPVIDIRLRLGLAERAYDDRTCIVVVSMGQKEIGLIVDMVDAVVAIAEDRISPKPPTMDKNSQSYLSGIARLENKVILLLDASFLLNWEFAENFDQYI